MQQQSIEEKGMTKKKKEGKVKTDTLDGIAERKRKRLGEDRSKLRQGQ